ncbi:MAG: hypothetical protein LC802_22220 [Acidobacteria bacterium]|nr:hypothetical protein [Acidobacteriota bacterium]
MSDKVSLIALRVAAIIEEFSEKDILRAIKLLEERGTSSSLLTYLAGNKKQGNSRQKTARKNGKSIEEQRSKVVLELEYKDPEKFQVLSEFDTLLRKSLVLPEIDDIKRLGERLSKNFSARSSRRELISKLMLLLADKSMDQVRDIVMSTLSNARVDEKDSDYQKLAQFIITGKRPQAEG